MKILLLGDYANNTIAALRSLGRRGHIVDVALPLSPYKFRYARRFASRFVNHQFRVPHPLAEADAFRRSLIDLARTHRYDAILPFDHRTTAWVSKWKAELTEHCGLAVADYDLYQLVHDKQRLHNLLAANGFAVPRSYPYQNLADLRASDLRYPVVVKARRGSGVAKGVRYATNWAELQHAHDEITRSSSPHPEVEDYSRPMVQEYIPGKIHDALFLFNQGREKAAMTQVREVTYPLSGGIGVENISTHNPELRGYGADMLRFLKWHGPCQVEVKQDDRDGSFKLLEINPKMWGTLDVAIKSGIDFALKSCELAAHGATATSFDYRIGLKYKFIFPLQFCVMHEDRMHRWRRFAQLCEVLTSGVKCELDLMDFKPDVARIYQTIRYLTRKRHNLPPRGRVFTAEDCHRLSVPRSDSTPDLRDAA